MRLAVDKVILDSSALLALFFLERGRIRSLG